MSTENVAAFFDKVAEEKVLQEKLKGVWAGVREGKKSLDAALGEAVQVAADAGYDFTVAELAQRFHSGERKASEEELKAVAGGGPGGLPCGYHSTFSWDPKGCNFQTLFMCPGGNAMVS